jgi:hypothetical protein
MMELESVKSGGVGKVRPKLGWQEEAKKDMIKVGLRRREGQGHNWRSKIS